MNNSIDFEPTSKILKGADKLRAFELNDGIGLYEATALRDLPYELDPDRAPFAQFIEWRDSALTFIVEPTRDSEVIETWLTYGVSPVTIVATSLSSVSSEEVQEIKKTYEFYGNINADFGKGEVRITHIDIEHEKPMMGAAFMFEEYDYIVTISFESMSKDEDLAAKVINTVLPIVENISQSPMLDFLAATKRAHKSAGDIAFELSVNGTLDGSDEQKILFDMPGWTAYTHNGGNIPIDLVESVDAGLSPQDIYQKFRAKLIEFPRDENGEQFVMWNDQGFQVILVPDDVDDLYGSTPILATVQLTNNMTIGVPSNDYDVLLMDDDSVGITGKEILAFAPIVNDVDDDVEGGESEEQDYEESYYHNYMGRLLMVNCIINAVACSVHEKAPEQYDEAFLRFSTNILNYVARTLSKEV